MTLIATLGLFAGGALLILSIAFYKLAAAPVQPLEDEPVPDFRLEDFGA